MSVAPEEPGVVKLPPHLLLAPNYATALKFIQTELGGPWKKVNRKTALSAADVRAIRSDYPESLWWIAEQYGDRCTGYDLAEAIKVWLKNNNAEDKSVCEVLKERGWEGIGEAEVFLSHVQAESPSETLRAMNTIDGARDNIGRRPWERGAQAASPYTIEGGATIVDGVLTEHTEKIWVDYFCLRQLRNDFQTKQVEQLIRKTGAVFVFIDGEETGSSYPTRSFCVFELASAVENGATLMIQTPNSGPLAPPAYDACCCCTCDCLRHPMPDYTIDAANATARRADDKAKVDKYIEDGPGFARVNQMMERELRRTAVKESWSQPVMCWCCCCMWMGLCFDGCCPRRNPCGCFLGFLQFETGPMTGPWADAAHVAELRARRDELDAMIDAACAEEDLEAADTLKTERVALEERLAALEGYHPGVTCDMTGDIIVGTHYKLVGENYDLCTTEYAKLSDEEKAKYEAIEPTNFRPKTGD